MRFLKDDRALAYRNKSYEYEINIGKNISEKYEKCEFYYVDLMENRFIIILESVDKQKKKENRKWII